MSYYKPILVNPLVSAADRPRAPTLAEAEAMVAASRGLRGLVPNVALTPLQRMQYSGALFPFCDGFVQDVAAALAHADGRVGPAAGPAQAQALEERQQRADLYRFLGARLGQLAQTFNDLYLLEQTQAVAEAGEVVKEGRARALAVPHSVEDEVWRMALKPAEDALSQRGRQPAKSLPTAKVVAPAEAPAAIPAAAVAPKKEPPQEPPRQRAARQEKRQRRLQALAEGLVDVTQARVQRPPDPG